LAGADALVVITEWNQVRGLDLARLAQSMRGKTLVDLRNIYTPEDAAPPASPIPAWTGGECGVSVRNGRSRPFCSNGAFWRGAEPCCKTGMVFDGQGWRAAPVRRTAAIFGQAAILAPEAVCSRWDRGGLAAGRCRISPATISRALTADLS